MDFRHIYGDTMPPRFYYFADKPRAFTVGYGANTSIKFQVPRQRCKVFSHAFDSRRKILRPVATQLCSEYTEFIERLAGDCHAQCCVDWEDPPPGQGSIVYEMNEDTVVFDDASAIVEDPDIIVGNEYDISMILNIKGGWVSGRKWKMVGIVEHLKVYSCQYETRPKLFIDGKEAQSIQKKIFL